MAPRPLSNNFCTKSDPTALADCYTCASLVLCRALLSRLSRTCSNALIQQSLLSCLIHDILVSSYYVLAVPWQWDELKSEVAYATRVSGGCLSNVGSGASQTPKCKQDNDGAQPEINMAHPYKTPTACLFWCWTHELCSSESAELSLLGTLV